MSYLKTICLQVWGHVIYSWTEEKFYLRRQYTGIISQLVQSLSSVWPLWPHETQHARPPCLSPTPGVYPNPCPLSRWCHLTISSSVIPFSSHLRSFPASGSFLMSQFFVSGGQVLELQLQHQSFQWIFKTDFLSDWLVGSPCCPRDSQESFPHHSSKASILQCSDFFIFQLSHPYMTTGKTIALTRWIFFSKVMPLLFNMLSRFSMFFFVLFCFVFVFSQGASVF